MLALSSRDFFLCAELESEQNLETFCLSQYQKTIQCHLITHKPSIVDEDIPCHETPVHWHRLQTHDPPNKPLMNASDSWL